MRAKDGLVIYLQVGQMGRGFSRPSRKKLGSGVHCESGRIILKASSNVFLETSFHGGSHLYSELSHKSGTMANRRLAIWGIFAVPVRHLLKRSPAPRYSWCGNLRGRVIRRRWCESPPKQLERQRERRKNRRQHNMPCRRLRTRHQKEWEGHRPLWQR